MYSLQDCYKTPKDSDLCKFGIYSIENIENHKQYVGSTSSSFSKRLRQHFNDLKNSKHHSNILQRSFNKYGVDSFSLKIIEVIDTRDWKILRSREQHWLDLLQPEYNILPNAESFLGHKHSEEVNLRQVKRLRQKFSDQNAGVKYYPKDNNWGVNIRVKGFRIHALGRFKTKEEAFVVRKEAESLFWTDEFDLLSLEEKKSLIKQFKKTKERILSNTGYKYIFNSFNKAKTKPYRFYFTGTGISRFFYTLEEAVVYRDKYLEENNLI